MTDLRFTTLRIPGIRVKRSSWFPAIRELIHVEVSADLDEDDGLFIGLGILDDMLPYTLQDDYDTPLETLSCQAAVLENAHLRAVFLPEYGGRLWSLYDKERRRDLILANTRILPCNLAIRNAWIAGGVEFNCGRVGHDAQTMSPRFTAVVGTDRHPVLRFYEYQRDRGVPFQYDCFLPEDSRFLYIRCRIWNPHRHMVPMYWWSNIAEPELPGGRIVVPANEAFATRYDGGSHVLSKVSLPDGAGFDATYPAAFECAKDHFYNIPESHRKYECLFHPDGYGFCHVSTSRLRGRKLFVWGRSPGGRHWNRKLLGPGLDAYVELQAGLGRCQRECLPMPPRTAWEWLEGYGSLTMRPQQVFGGWTDAVDNVSRRVEEASPADALEKLLRETRGSIALKPGRVVVSGSGWGALEELRMGGRLAPQLDFGTVGEEQEAWAELLKTRTMTGSAPVSYQVSDEWFELLKQAKPSWQTYYHLALNHYRRKDTERAESEIRQAGDASGNRHLLHLLANLRVLEKRPEEAGEYILEAARLDLGDVSFLKESLKMLLALHEYGRMDELLKALSPDVAGLPLVRLMRAFAFAHLGRLDEAEDILTGHGEWEIPDIREGENSTSQLYCFIQSERARLAGRPFDPDGIRIPPHLYLRMSTANAVGNGPAGKGKPA